MFFQVVIISCALWASFQAISTFNAVAMVLFVILVYVLVASLCMQVGASVLAILLVLIYGGALAILFLFVIMMLNLRTQESYDKTTSYFPVGFFLGIMFFFEWFVVIGNDYWFGLVWGLTPVLEINDILVTKVDLYFLGQLLINYNSLFILVAALVLLLALVGAIALTIGFKSEASLDFQGEGLASSVKVIKFLNW